MSTQGSHQNVPSATSAHERAEHQHLVGQRVEERPRAGGALAAGQDPVGPVGEAEHDPERDRRPRRAVVADHRRGTGA